MNQPSPYYQPGGPHVPDRPSRVHWLPYVIAAVFVGIALLFLAVIAFPGAFGISGPAYSSRYGLFGGFFGLFFLLLICFFIVRVVFWGTRAGRYGGRNRYGPGGGYGSNRPMMVARMRYARGEITREQYDQIVQDLSRPPGTP
jgi:putative membrane protein